MITLTETPLNTGYANETTRGLLAQVDTPEVELYHDCQTLHEVDAARVTEARAEDRFIAFITGATPSEVWA